MDLKIHKQKRIKMDLRISSNIDSPFEGKEFLPKGEFKVILDYPLDKLYTFKVKGPLTAYDLALYIIKHYKKIYDQSEKYGVWGHDIDDLVVERLRVNLDTKIVAVDVGS